MYLFERERMCKWEDRWSRREGGGKRKRENKSQGGSLPSAELIWLNPRTPKDYDLIKIKNWTQQTRSPRCPY